MSKPIKKRGIPEYDARPVVFGEVLYDCFPDGREVLGGAPFNVAWHLQGLGFQPLMISRVGTDERGDQVLHAMDEWGMDTSGMQRDSEHPTGTVQVKTEGASNTFDIVDGVAYDFIDEGEAMRALRFKPGAMLYHGTLALRRRPNENVLRRLRLATNAVVFLDINLRAPWWNMPDVMRAVHRAQYVKLNDDELTELTGRESPDPDALIKNARTFARQLGIAVLILTRGAEGAVQVNTGQSVFVDDTAAVDDIVDTVGAGDAFSAMTIKGALLSWKPEQILRRASRFAMSVCRIRGGTTTDRALYEQAGALS